MNRLPLIEKIHFLESRLSDRWVHPILEPFKFDSLDIVKVQEAGKKIVQHLGLPPQTFLISYVQQKSNVAGNIELNNTKNVFVEIESKFRHDHEMVLAILAHEICHKYLQINNLKLFPDIENEILTDAATVYTGLGKLSLNGCEKTTSSSSTSGNVTITTQKVGYLNRLQFAFIYRLVCEMRNIPKKEMMQGLSSEAANLVNSESRNSSSYFNKKFFSDKIISQIISEEISLSQKEIATLNRRIRESQEIILPTAIELSEDFHVYTKSKIGPLMQMATKQVNKESHSYIKNLLALEEFKFYKSKMIEKEKELKEFAISLQKFLVDINRNYSKYLSKKSYEFLFQFKCPSCNKDLIIREKTLARVKCQKCNYSFIVDTGIDEVKNGFWERAKSLFKK